MTTARSSIPEVQLSATAPARLSPITKERNRRLIGVSLITAALVSGGLYLAVGNNSVLRDVSEIRVPDSQAQRALSGVEVTKLFSGATVTGVHHLQNFRFRHYYAPEGTLESTRDDSPAAAGTWGVSPRGRLCIQLRNRGELCRTIVFDNGAYKKVLKQGPQEKLIVSYSSFTRGRHVTQP